MQSEQNKLPHPEHSLGVRTTFWQIMQSNISPIRLGNLSFLYPFSLIFVDFPYYYNIRLYPFTFNLGYILMSGLVFQEVPGWSFTENDLKAQIKIQQLKNEACSKLPAQFKSRRILCLFDQIRSTGLYSALKTLPKGVLHHLHFDCAEDEDFYAQHVITDPIVYLSKDMKGFKLGTKEQAEKEQWISMKSAREKFQSDRQFVKYVSNITILNKEEMDFLTKCTIAECWTLFEQKISNFFPIIGAAHLLKKYTIHILRKHIKNGYDRIEFRALLNTVDEYNQSGEIVAHHGKDKFLTIIDEAFNIVRQEDLVFTIGFIFFGLKYLKPEENEQILTEILQKNWSKTIGIDFVQQQDPNGSQANYDQIANRVLANFPNCNVKKVYHSGQTKDHLNKNVQISIKSGSVRIGHGINVVQHPSLLKLCAQKKICFEQCPVSNLIGNYVLDPRMATTPLLLGLGIPVTLNSDDPGKFGLEDSTMDYFISFISSNWSLRHLKLMAIYSIIHAICCEETKKELINSFNKRWDGWASHFIS